MNPDNEPTRIFWSADNFWHSWPACPRGRPTWKTTPSDDGMVLCPNEPGMILNGLLMSLTPADDGGTIYSITTLNQHDHPWAWTDAPVWPTFVLAPRLAAAQVRLRSARVWVRYRFHRVADAWLVLVGRQHVADDYDW